MSQGGKLLSIPLLHHAKAAELALDAVEVSVVVGVAGDEAVAADVVIGLDTLDDMYGKGNSGNPRFSCLFISEVEFG